MAYRLSVTKTLLCIDVRRTCGRMTTFSGAVVDCAPGAGPKGRARWRKESASAMLGRLSRFQYERTTIYVKYKIVVDFLDT